MVGYICEQKSVFGEDLLKCLLRMDETMLDVEGPMDSIDPPPSLGKGPSWLRDTLEDAEGHMAPRRTFRESKKPSRY